MGSGRGICLVLMGPGRDSQFAAMMEEYRANGEMDVYRGHQAVAWQGYSGYYDLLSRMKQGGYPTPDIVPMDSYFIEEDGQILGELFIRHRLSDQLEKVGGHIGYRVRPTQRNRGVATAALKLGLEKLNQLGVVRALVTCDERNLASARVIEKCGGSRIEDASVEERIKRRYLVPTAARRGSRFT
jgi:predicted acetyltransferase